MSIWTYDFRGEIHNDYVGMAADYLCGKLREPIFDYNHRAKGMG